MNDLEATIVEAIATHTPFSFINVRDAYLFYKSFDKLIAAINLSGKLGLGYIANINPALEPLRTDIDQPAARMQQILENGLGEILKHVLKTPEVR